ncbi:cache domain-containing protein [Colwellia sp. BRX10-4]|jgi:two-component system NarL family sensor kinase|uniref:cache domain-containing protein n=1 Tax=Colwellia sp. BRX10-4 TaxID=2759843 RepID=UPI002174DBE5|nr:cache domain-containing protein [Colwellia sp. BRX10-4]
MKKINKHMTLPLKLLYIAVIQVLITALITHYLVTNEYRELSSQSLETLEHFLVEQKKQELKNYTALAVSAVDHLYQPSEANNHVAKALVTNILDKMQYNGEDGYFFVYDDKGNAISHPKQPFRIGKNWWDLVDDKGNKIIQILINNAKAGGDFYHYPWTKPSNNEVSEKIGYSVYLDKWKWMIGTGVYLDNVNLQLSNLQSEIDEHINKTKKIILILAISSIFIIFMFGLIVNLRQKKQTDKKIIELEQRIVNVQEDENRRIARELHDGIIQILVSIKFSLEATTMHLLKASQQIPKPLEHAKENLIIAIEEIRRISHHMHPQILDELGLSAAIDVLSADFSNREGISIKVFKPSARNLLPDFINTTLYRIVQESLTNIVKHAKAEHVEISLSIDKNWLKLIIADDGRGFDISSVSEVSESGIGLRNLAERVEYHLGEFTIVSSSKGTVITTKIPKSSFENYFHQTRVKQSKNNNSEARL